MNKYIIDYIKREYGFDCENASQQQLNKVHEILCKSVTPFVDIFKPKPIIDWDFSLFPNLKQIDCSYNYANTINILSNHKLEIINWSGVRGNLKKNIDFSGCPNLKKIYGGQDGQTIIDLSNNPEIEEISIFLSQDLRWLDIHNCKKLKKISLVGCLIPIVDLTNCPLLESVEIHYARTYVRYSNLGLSYCPVPYLFVSPDLNLDIIKYRREGTHTIVVYPDSFDVEFLHFIYTYYKYVLFNIPSDSHCVNIGKHYESLCFLYDSMKEEYNKKHKNSISKTDDNYDDLPF